MYKWTYVTFKKLWMYVFIYPESFIDINLDSIELKTFSLLHRRDITTGSVAQNYNNAIKIV